MGWIARATFSAAVLAAALATTACDPEFKRIGVGTTDEAQLRLSWRDCTGAQPAEVSVADGGAVLWEIVLRPSGQPTRDFTYGEEPPGYETRVAPQPLPEAEAELRASVTSTVGTRDELRFQRSDLRAGMLLVGRIDGDYLTPDAFSNETDC